MNKVKSVEELDVFKLAHELTLDIYRVTNDFPKEEIYGLVSQLRRAAGSVPANLTEGGNRNTKAEFRHFAGIAKGSAGEARYQLLLAKDLGYLEEERYETLADGYGRVLQMLQKLVRSLS
ncbi:MAG: four helix bundle protein [Deltaproteobacteria bacterium]|nr:four helix bundle protein [Deltaproteobacteria bacterium]